ncbi:serine/threonine-protein phosphatase 6 regulatory subunit 3-like [Oppia nitens]|uniref:serine/threonine-protein phosphatase 6 regulatory subunit 3-like n=1 Tax=Oppia nitens TaxID=1686743 RepID=UPI0023DBE96B|nr:serine/threonine-protein phosphatase 6 regulatory subunit 3-like [Oppia nitens]
MFWQFDNGFVSQIGTILDKENVTLQELMDEDDILQECKAQTQKLIDFLTRPPIIDEMINLITNEPPVSLDQRLRFKYANIACEILTTDVMAIADALVADDQMLNKLYNFIDTDRPLNPLMASFFSKVMGVLFVKKTDFVFDFLKSKDLISLLLTHIETSAVMDLILKLIISVDNLDLRNIIIKWLHDNELIPKLLAIFKTNCSSQKHINAAQLICDIIKITREHQSQYQDNVDNDLLLDTLESTDTVAALLDNIISCRTESSLVSGLTIIQSLLEYKRHCMNINIQQHIMSPQNNINESSAEFEGMPQCFSQQMANRVDGCGQPTALDTERLAKSIRQVEAAILPRLEAFSDLLENPPKQQPIQTTVGLIEKPLGAIRLEVAHLITALLSTNDESIREKLAQMNTLPILINLFFEYQWNNFLHKQVEQSIACILNNNNNNNNCKSGSNSNCSTQSAGDEPMSSTPIIESSSLVIQLLTQCQLIDRLCDVFDEKNSNTTNSSYNESVEPNASSYKPKPGYMGHLVIIANLIKDKCDDQCLQKYLSAEVFDKWKSFVDQTLDKINKIHSTPLVNEMPNMPMDEESRRQQDTTLQQVFMDYQMQQMTRNLCQQITFSANEFTELNDNIPNQIDSFTRINFNFDTHLQQKDKSLQFEKICAERAKDSIDTNSSDEEDLWEDRDQSFNNRTMNSEPKKSVSLLNDEAFGFNSSNNRYFNPMDVDQSDPWSDSANSGPVAMETSNPWEGSSSGSQVLPTSTSGAASSNIEADSWADFSGFSNNNDFNSNEFSSSMISTSTTNTTTARHTSTESSLSSHSTTAFAESTSCEPSTATVLSSSEAAADFGGPKPPATMTTTINSSSQATVATYASAVNNSLVTADQENAVTSSTSDLYIANGPNS